MMAMGATYTSNMIYDVRLFSYQSGGKYSAVVESTEINLVDKGRHQICWQHGYYAELRP